MTDQAEPVNLTDRSDRARGVGGSLAHGLAFYYTTSLIVIVAVVFALDFVPLYREHPASKTRVDLPSALAAWDGVWYGHIATKGYSYDPKHPSALAFFPLYPILAGMFVYVTGMRTEFALLLISHGALAAAFGLLGAYVQQRAPTASDDLQGWTLLAFGLFPTTFYFRMAYTESLFALLTLVAFFGMERAWRPVWIALNIGLATATRSVGVALVPVFALYLWQRVRTHQDSRANLLLVQPFPQWLLWAVHLGLLVPVCCWGLLSYAAYQWYTFGEPLAFVKTQEHWSMRPLDFGQRTVGLLALEPLRALYDSSCPCYWGHSPPGESPLFNLKAVTPAYFLVTAGLVGFGAYRRWLNAREVLLSVGLLLIPYCLHASRTCMNSEARYASVVFPVYIVLGHLLQRAPPTLAAGLIAISAIVLAIYSAMFVSWYWYY